jgi:hypothetical protein
VAERRQLAGELKAAGDKDAAKLAKLARPPISAWAVDQLVARAVRSTRCSTPRARPPR